MTPLNVVIPTYNNLPELKACLESLERQTIRGFRALICVDGSTDGTLEYLTDARLAFERRVLTHVDGSNHGRAAARNLALGEIDAAVTVLLDSDMRLAPDALERHAALVTKSGEASVGSITYSNARSSIWARYLMTRGRSRWRPGARLPFNQFVTSNSALRSDDFLALGGFDSSIVSYGGEDTEFAFRLVSVRQRGIVNNPSARAISIEPKPVAQALGELHTFSRINLPHLYRIHPDMPSLFMTDRLQSSHPLDRMFRLMLNPLTDMVAGAVIRTGPDALRMKALNYAVIRAVSRGYLEAVETEEDAT